MFRPREECPKLPSPPLSSHTEVADLCLGWFWSPDAVFSALPGVLNVVVGYAGGKESDPTYRSIKDHTEAVRVEFDPQVISYEEILECYFKQLGRSMFYPSYSRQYRNAILVHNTDQKCAASAMIQRLSKENEVHVTVQAATDFYRAEEYHQKYFHKQKGIVACSRY